MKIRNKALFGYYVSGSALAFTLAIAIATSTASLIAKFIAISLLCLAMIFTAISAVYQIGELKQGGVSKTKEKKCQKL